MESCCQLTTFQMKTEKSLCPFTTKTDSISYFPPYCLPRQCHSSILQPRTFCHICNVSASSFTSTVPWCRWSFLSDELSAHVAPAFFETLPTPLQLSEYTLWCPTSVFFHLLYTLPTKGFFSIKVKISFRENLIAYLKEPVAFAHMFPTQ